MNFRMIFNTTGKAMVAEGVLMAFPLIMALILKEACVNALAITVGICLVGGFLLALLSKNNAKTFFSRDGLVAVAFVWIAIAVFGALPFCISGQIPSFFDAFFESVSGFTTTGASILDDPSVALEKSLLLWRSLTHWIGGMGVIVFVMALTASSDNSMHVLRAEMPGVTVDKLTPRASDTAKRLYLIYIGFTVLEVVLLLFGKVNPLESVIYAFGTAGTGGFGIYADSIAGYSSYVQWVITVFMLLFGVNFNIYYLIFFLGRVKSALKSKELHAYGLTVFVAIAIISVNLAMQGDSLAEVTSVADAIRLSAFQVASYITTTGYGTANATNWPILSKAVLFLLMFIGGCAGSTAGGLKVSRVQLLIRKIGSEVRRTLHPRTTTAVKFEGKAVDETTLNGVTSYFALYGLSMAVVFLLLCFDNSVIGNAFETNITATVSCFNNIGPFYSVASSYGMYNAFSKVVLSFAMLFGRLEIYPMIVLFSPATWKRS